MRNLLLSKISGSGGWAPWAPALCSNRVCSFVHAFNLIGFATGPPSLYLLVLHNPSSSQLLFCVGGEGPLLLGPGGQW